MNIAYERGYFTQDEDIHQLSCDAIFRTVVSKMIASDLRRATLLQQSGILLAPIFVLQRPPSQMQPWWGVSVVQYHSIEADMLKCSVNAWEFISFENLVGESLDVDLPLHPSSGQNGLIGHNIKVRFEFTPTRHIIFARQKQRAAKPIRSFLTPKDIQTDEYIGELHKLIGAHGYGILSDEKIREDYPRQNISALLEEISSERTLETEISYILQ